MRAIVCSGGGNRGAAQAGALEVLLSAGVVPDLFVGTSVGAINAAFLAADPSPNRARCLVEIWQGLRGRDVFPTPARVQLIRLALGSDHVCSSDGLRALLETHLGYREIEDASVPLVVVATDLSTGAERRLRHGPVVPAVLASAAIPGVFAPVPWGSDLLVDGGVVANVPLAAAVAAGADEVWALDTGQRCAERHRPRSAVGVARRSVAVQSTARAEAELACLPPGVTVHHVVLPCSTHLRYSDFSGSAELVAGGAAAASEALDGADVGPARARQRSRATRQRSRKGVVDDSERRSSRRRPSDEAAPSVHDTSGGIGRHNQGEGPGHEVIGGSPASAGSRRTGVSRRFATRLVTRPGSSPGSSTEKERTARAGTASRRQSWSGARASHDGAVAW